MSDHEREVSRAGRWFDERLAQLPDTLREVLRLELPSLAELSFPSWDVCGVGGSSGPAQLCVQAMNQRELRACFREVSHFVGPTALADQGRGLILFSQGLSPHARLVLERGRAYASVIVITSRPTEEVRAVLSPNARGSLKVIRHPSGNEDRSLLRINGPTGAALLGLRVACALTGYQGQAFDSVRLSRVPSLYSAGGVGGAAGAPLARPFPDGALTYCLATSVHQSSARQLMWKWHEALEERLPPVIDAMGFAHGPFQSIYEGTARLLVLQGTSPEEGIITQRIRAIVKPSRHSIVVLSAQEDFPLSYFEFESQFFALMRATATHRSLDPATWPGKDEDRPLYALSPDELGSSG